MRRISIICFFLLSLILSADDVRVEPLEFWQSASQWPESLTVDQLITASLAASGAQGGTLDRYVQDLTGQVDDFTSSVLPSWSDMSDAQKGEELLLWLHGEVLIGNYHTDQTRMDILLNRGDYNCVSSAVLYLIFSRAAHLQSAGEETTDHAFCTVTTQEGDKIDVETTTAAGFDPGTKKEFTQAFTGRTGFTYVAPGNYRQRKPASDKDMITLILQNRIALYQRRNDFVNAVGPAVDRWFFSPTDINRRDMNDAFRNYTSRLNGQGRFQEAMDFLVPLSRELDLLDENRDLVGILVENQLITFLNRDDPDGAESFLNEWETSLDEGKLHTLMTQIVLKKAEMALTELSYPDALALIRGYRDEGSLPRSRADEMISWLHQERGMTLFKETGADDEASYWNVIAFFDALPAGEKELPGIRDHREKYRQNWAVMIHNRFASLVNRKEYDRAGEVLDQALLRDGSNTTLLKDQTFLDRIRNSR
ncbi:MAG: hypothetical protein JXA95_09760 [Spirochaetales bacterium]|nr:hypothetical protein [Spirochaetales bacterium]